MKFRKLFFILPLIIALAGCSATNNDVTPSDPSGDVQDYEYVEYKDGIKLTKCNKEYSPVIRIPDSIDGKRVLAYASGCFKKASLVKRAPNDKNDDDELCTTYTFGDGVEEIEEGTFDNTSTFFTESTEPKEGWSDSAMTGSAIDNEGNVYYDTKDANVVVENGSVYSLFKRDGTFNFARCLSEEKEVNIASEINGKKVVAIGEKSFYLNKTVEIVNFPNTIGTILSYAFKGCTNLKEINFDSPNLSIIKPETFSECESLDSVRLPENLTKIMSKAFSNCGTLSELFIPSSIVGIYDDILENTILEKIVFEGSQERWNELMELNGCSSLRAIPVECLGKAERVVVDRITDLANIDNGTQIVVRGILSGYSRYQENDNKEYTPQFAMLMDMETNFCVTCYNGLTEEGKKLLYDLSLVGREVQCVGYKNTFYGSIQITNGMISLTEDETIYDLNPTQYDWEKNDFNASEHIGEYMHYEGTYLGNYKFSNIDINCYYIVLDYPSLGRKLKAGDTVSFDMWIIIYNQIYNFYPNMDTFCIVA